MRTVEQLAIEAFEINCKCVQSNQMLCHNNSIYGGICAIVIELASSHTVAMVFSVAGQRAVFFLPSNDNFECDFELECLLIELPNRFNHTIYSCLRLTVIRRSIHRSASIVCNKTVARQINCFHTTANAMSHSFFFSHTKI